MASGGGTVDAEKKEAYYLRLHLLIVKQGTSILKARFDHSVLPVQLHQKLQHDIQTINYGKRNNFISRAQYNLLFPPHNPPKSENFDVSLLVYLLRNICGLKPKSKWWNETDNTKIPDAVIDEEADIVRIRNMRNLMQHKHVASLEQVEFGRMWELIEKAMLRLAVICNIGDQKQKIDELKTEQLDLVSEEMRSMRAHTEAFLQNYEDNEQYVETTAYDKAKTILGEKQIVILSGHPGEGKTTMAARLALDLSEPRNCLYVAAPSDWRKIDISLKLFDIVIIDDIFGAGALDQRLVADWNRFLPEIERAAKNKALRVIITSRHYIFEESKYELGSVQMFKDDNGTMLLLSSADLSREEKERILKIQATKNEKLMPNNIISECIEASETTEHNSDFLFGFPECAAMFVRNVEMYKSGASFFKKPASFFKRYLEETYQGRGEYKLDKFLALVAVWAKENKRLSKEEIRRTSKVSESVKHIADIYDREVDHQFLETMTLSLDANVGGFLVYNDTAGEYAFSHNVIGDMVGLVIGKLKPEETVEISPRDFLMSYVTVSVDEPIRDEFKIVLKERQYDSLAKKCTEMLLRRDCNTVADNSSIDEFHILQRTGQRSNDINIDNTIDFGIIKHTAFKYQMFVNIFIDHVVQQNLVEEVFAVPMMTMKGYFLDYGISMRQLDMCLMGYAWYSGATVFAQEVITRGILAAENFDRSISLLLATHSRERNSVEFLLAHGAEVTGDVIYIAAHKSIDLLQRLLGQPGTNVNDRGNAVNGNYPLIVVARKGLDDAVSCLLHHGADLAVQNTANMTALHNAILYKRTEVIKTLVEGKAPLDTKGGKFKRTPLHLAVDLGNEKLVKYLLRKGASCVIKDHRGHYPIHIAAIKGHIKIVRQLFNSDRTQDKLRISSYGTKSIIKGMSIFHIAVWKKNEELLDALIDMNADPNIQDFFGQTPLFFAIMTKQEAIVGKLLAYARTDKTKAQKQGYTPLHASIQKNLNDSAKKLAECSNINAQDKFGRTPLHVACEKANAGIINILLQSYGADPRMVTKRGDTVYHILRRNRKKLPDNKVDNSKLAEQLLIEFDPHFAKQLPKLKNKAGIVVKVSHSQMSRSEPPVTAATLADLVAIFGNFELNSDDGDVDVLDEVGLFDVNDCFEDMDDEFDVGEFGDAYDDDFHCYD